MKKIIFSLFLFCIALSLHAGAPLTHLYLADMFLSFAQPYDKAQEIAFMKGNLYPDIKYLGVKSHAETHEENISFEDILKSDSPFRAGICLHVCVDQIRDSFIQLVNAFSLVTPYEETYPSTLLKCVEDEILFNKLNVDYYRDIFNEVNDDELAMGISYDTMSQWHAYLQNYLSKKPSEQLAELALEGKPYRKVPPEKVKVWSELVPKLAQDREVQLYFDLLCDHFSLLYYILSREYVITLPASPNETRFMAAAS